MALVAPAGKTEGVEVAAVAARDSGRAAAFAARHRIAVVHDSYEALLADPEIDVVYNPLPNGLHGSWSVRALEAGKDVLCEKPLAANADEARVMVDAAAMHGRRLVEAFHYRYHPLVTRVREIIASGEIGTVRRYEAAFIVPIIRADDIRYRYDLAGGGTMDLGCYPIHLIRTLAAAEPTVKTATAVEGPVDIDRSMDAELEFADGRTARMQCSMWSPRVLRVNAHIEGDAGTIDVFNFVAPQIFNSVVVRSAAGRRRERVSGPATYTAQLRAFTAALRDKNPLPTEGEDSVSNMRVIDAVYAAAGLPLRKPADG